MNKMKRVLTLSVAAVIMGGSVQAKDVKTFADTVRIVQNDTELQEQTVVAMRQVVSAFEQWLSFVIKKIDQNATERDQQHIRAIVKDLEALVRLYGEALKAGDLNVVDPETQQKGVELLQSVAIRGMLLTQSLSDYKATQTDMDLVQKFGEEFIVEVSAALARINADLK